MEDNGKVSKYLFTVEIDGIETARFQKCEGLEAETYVYEVEEGGLGTHKFSGRTRYPNIILEKGISDNDELFNWYKQTLLEDRTIERKNGSIVLKDIKNNEIKRWNFFRALPCRWIGPRLDARLTSEFAVERIEIIHEGLEVDNDSAVNLSSFQIGVDMSGNQNFVGNMENSESASQTAAQQNTDAGLSGTREQFIANMEDLVGTPYVYGGNSPADGGMDCSGSVIYALNQMGNNIPDQTASDIYNNLTTPVENGDFQPGDLRFLRNSEGDVSHVQVITGTDGTRVNATGGPENNINNPGIIESLQGPLPTSGEVRRLNWGE
jgi:phage tail-like protein